MKNKSIILLLLVLLCSVTAFSSVSAEVCKINDALEFIAGENFSCYPDDDGLMLIDLNNFSILFIHASDTAALEMDQSLLDFIFSSKTTVSMISDSLTVDSGPYYADNITWYWGKMTNDDGSINDTAIGLAGSYLLMVPGLNLTLDEATNVINNIHPAGTGETSEASTESTDTAAEQAAGSALPSDASAPEGNEISGFYDLKAIYGENGVDTDINLILTPNGAGRIINSTDSVTFNFTWDGTSFETDTTEMTMRRQDEKSIVITIENFNLTFIKRDDVPNADAYLGEWELVGLISNGSELGKDFINEAGYVVTMTIYADGCIEVHNNDDLIANGLELISDEYFYNNGSDLYAVMLRDDGILSNKLDDGTDVVELLYERLSGPSGDDGGNGTNDNGGGGNKKIL